MTTQLRRAHDHPITGQVVVVHSPGTTTKGVRTETPSHAIGPFRSEREAETYHAMFKDECDKLLIDLIEPVWD